MIRIDFRPGDRYRIEFRGPRYAVDTWYRCGEWTDRAAAEAELRALVGGEMGDLAQPGSEWRLGIVRDGEVVFAAARVRKTPYGFQDLVGCVVGGRRAA